MPSTRRTSSRAVARSNSTGRQSTLSFNNRVSKAGAAKATTAKDIDAAAAPTLTPPPSVKRKAAAEVTQTDEEDEQEDVAAEVAEVKEEAEKPQAEVRARKVTDAQVKKYWRGVEGARIAKRVHQGELSLGEKVLRYFDISSQYGPCIGIPRTKRWYRAERLGLNPPVEVLAVLLKEEKLGDGGMETSAMDRHLSSTAVGGS